MALRLAPRNVFARVVEGSIRFCQWIDDPMAAILVRALSAVNPGKVGAAAVTSGSGNLLVRILADPVVKHHRLRTPGAAPSTPRHGIEGLQFRVKEVFVYLLRSVFLTVCSVRLIVIQQGRQIQMPQDPHGIHRVMERVMSGVAFRK